MRRRTLDIIISSGAVALAGLLLVLGLVLNNRGDFAKRYVADELMVQAITFPAAEDLNERDLAYTEARSGCLLRYAGEQVATGPMAECYANEYIGSHLTYLATRLGKASVADVDGLSYTQLGAEQGNIREQIAAATAAGSPALADLEQRLEDVSFVRQKMFEGTMLRSGLLTSYGFSQFGTTADNSAAVAFVVGGILLLLAIAGFAHAFRTPKSKAFALPEPENGRAARKEVVSV